MRPIGNVITQELTWTRAGTSRRTYELHAGAEVVATLRYARGWGADAVVEAGDSCWTFRRVGFWHPRVTVRVVGSETDLATFHARGMGRGMLDPVPHAPLPKGGHDLLTQQPHTVDVAADRRDAAVAHTAVWADEDPGEGRD